MSIKEKESVVSNAPAGSGKPKNMKTMDGNTAAAHVSYLFTDVAAIYPKPLKLLRWNLKQAQQALFMVPCPPAP